MRVVLFQIVHQTSYAVKVNVCVIDLPIDAVTVNVFYGLGVVQIKIVHQIRTAVLRGNLKVVVLQGMRVVKIVHQTKNAVKLNVFQKIGVVLI
jgi:hypothetical protein